MSDLLNTLEALDLIISVPGISSADLCDRLNVSDRTLKRYINEARDLGAQVESVRFGKSYGWSCLNADAVLPRLRRWIDLERNKLAPVIMPDDSQAICEWLNCRVADVDADGDVWVSDPMTGHWLSDNAKSDYVEWRAQNTLYLPANGATDA